MYELLPATVIAAIALFLVKEVLEFFRRRRADARKLRALQALLAAEVERNHFTIKRLRDMLQSIEEALVKRKTFRLTKESDGTNRLAIEGDDGFHSWPVPTIHNDVLSKSLLELALLDKGLFEKALLAADAIGELQHVRRSMVQQVTERIERPGTDHLAGFSEYALREVDDAQATLATLYLFCTGKPLSEWRVR